LGDLKGRGEVVTAQRNRPCVRTACVYGEVIRGKTWSITLLVRGNREKLEGQTLAGRVGTTGPEVVRGEWDETLLMSDQEGARFRGEATEGKSQQSCCPLGKRVVVQPPGKCFNTLAIGLRGGVYSPQRRYERTRGIGTNAPTGWTPSN